MNEEKRARSVTTDGRPPAPGFEATPAPQPLGPNGQYGAYWVLSEAERAKGFVRPVRRAYQHTGPAGPQHPLRVLTDEEQARHGISGYTHFEEYPESESPLTGRFWTAAQQARVANGCQTVTTMGPALCETYARDPTYYGSTFCCGCRTHLPVAEFRWVEDGTVLGS